MAGGLHGRLGTLERPADEDHRPRNAAELFRVRSIEDSGHPIAHSLRYGQNGQAPRSCQADVDDALCLIVDAIFPGLDEVFGARETLAVRRDDKAHGVILSPFRFVNGRGG